MKIRFSSVMRSSALFLVAVFSVLPYSNTAMAQEDNQVAALDEVIVTARKRAENLMQVPLAITTFSAQDIESAGISNLDDVANLTPGLNFFNPIGEFLPTPVIRGMAPTDIFGENNAAMFIDGVYLSGRAGLNFNQLDLERIEVNKGPQAALYGRNAFSGAINLVTARPTRKFESKVELQMGDPGIVVGKAVLSGPFSDSLMGRIAVSHNEWDGSYDNSHSGSDVGGHEYQTVQASLLFEPSDGFDLLASVFVSDDKIDPNATSSVQVNCQNTNFLAPIPPRLSAYCGEVPSLGGTDIPKIAAAWGEKRDLLRTQLSMNWNLENSVFSSLTSYSDTEQDIATDSGRSLADTVPYVYCNSPSFVIPGMCAGLSVFTSGALQRLPQPDTVDEFSQEFRYSGQSGRLSYDVGVNYFDVESTQASRYIVATEPLPADFMGFGPFVVVVPPSLAMIPIGTGVFAPWFGPNGGIASSFITTDKTEAWSGFAAIDYKLSDRLNGRAEFRITTEDKQQIIGGGNVDGSDAVLDDTWDLFSWRLGLDFQATDDWMIYGSVAQAEKPGKFSSTIVGVITDATVAPPVVEDRLLVTKLDAETNLTIEMGTKGTLADGRVSLTAAVYYTDWQDIIMGQTFTEDPNTGEQLETPIGLDGNIASADIFGLEIESRILLADSWSINLGASVTDAELKDTKTRSFASYPDFAPDGDVSGNKLLRQPRNMANASLVFDPQGSGDWQFFGRADVMYQSKVYEGNANLAYFPEHTYVNASFGIRNDKWTVELWGRNLFEDTAPVGGFRDVLFNNTSDVNQSMPPASHPAADFFPWRLTVTQPRLRTYGITVRANFGNTG